MNALGVLQPDHIEPSRHAWASSELSEDRFEEKLVSIDKTAIEARTLDPCAAG